MTQTNHPNFQLNLIISDKEKRNTFWGGKSVKIVLPPFYEESTLPNQTPFQKGLSMQDSKQEVKKSCLPCKNCRQSTNVSSPIKSYYKLIFTCVKYVVVSIVQAKFWSLLRLTTLSDISPIRLTDDLLYLISWSQIRFDWHSD